MTRDPVQAIADAVLYEGYILWPYRRSAMKNRHRFTFGGVYPPAHSAAHPDDPSTMQTEVLVTGEVEARVRFLQVVERTIHDARGRPVEQLEIAGERYLSWQEAVEREIRAPGPIAIAAGSETEELGDASLIRTWEPLKGTIELSETSSAAPGVRRVSVTVRNETPFPSGGMREDALKRTFCSTHMLLRATTGEFISLTDPPPELAGEAAACRNVGTWPVLVGDPTTMLSSPIILEDYPRVAPESPGDMFDGGEIDQLLILNILTLTDEEKAEMAASDPRAREILERAQALTPDQMMALHGTFRR